MTLPGPTSAGSSWKDFAAHGRIGRTFAESRPWWPNEPAAPPGAPNVIVVLLDDMGFSDTGPFGSEIATPRLDQLATAGYRLTNYHTAPVCSPARAALLSGINPHRAGYASVVDTDAGFPSYAMELAEDVASLPEIMRANGYATFAVGKWHLARVGALHDGGERRSWPTQRGFDRYYGTMEGLNSFFHPNRLVRDNSPLDVEELPDDYYLTDDLTDESIKMLKGLRASSPKPFFLYFCHQAMHGPLGAKPADLAQQRGHYSAGWDELRTRRFERQLALGLFPPGTELPPYETSPRFRVTPWADLPAGERSLFERHMEVYAAMVANVDYNLGRLLDTVAAMGELDNTIIVFLSDNGGTHEGGPRGTRSYFRQFIHALPVPSDWEGDIPRDVDLIGGPRMMAHYPRAWGWVSNTPFRLYKANTFAGGIRVPFVLSWAAGLPRRADDSGIRHGYQYVTDLLPTLVDLVGLQIPERRHGYEAQRVDGASFAEVLIDGAAPSTHHEQYAEFGGNRGFYRDGWKIVTSHLPGTAYDDAEWQLFHVATDPTEVRDLAASEPERLAEMAAAWETAATTNGVFPLDDGSGYLAAARRPAEEEMLRPVTVLPGTPTVERYRSSRLIALRSFTATITLTHEEGAEGILLAHGDQGGGYQIVVEGPDLRFTYNAYGVLAHLDTGALPAGPHAITLVATAIDGFRWDFRLDVDGTTTGCLAQQPMLLFLAPFTGIDVGICRGGPVDWDLYRRRRTFPYTAQIHHVRYHPGPAAPYDPAVVLGLAAEAGEQAD